MIIAGSTFAEIDARTDAVFCACDGNRNLAEVAQQVAERLGCEIGTALVIATAGVLVLASLNVLELPAGDHL